MSKNNISKLLDKLEEVRRTVDRMEKLCAKLDEDWGDMSFIAWLEDDLKEEKIYASDGRLCLTGFDHDIGWSFEDIIKDGLHVWNENTEEDHNALRRMAAEFRRLADMFAQAVEEKVT